MSVFATDEGGGVQETCDPRTRARHARIERGLFEQARTLRTAPCGSLAPRILAALPERDWPRSPARRWPRVTLAAALLLGLLTTGWSLWCSERGVPSPSKGLHELELTAAPEPRAPSIDARALPRLLHAAAPSEAALLAEVRGLQHDSRAALRFLLSRVRLGPGTSGG